MPKYRSRPTPRRKYRAKKPEHETRAEFLRTIAAAVRAAGPRPPMTAHAAPRSALLPVGAIVGTTARVPRVGLLRRDTAAPRIQAVVREAFSVEGALWACLGPDDELTGTAIMQAVLRPGHGVWLVLHGLSAGSFPFTAPVVQS